jgi:hypothetical protein
MSERAVGEASLPTPTGTYPVGRSAYHWRDDRHDLVVWIWYPAAPAPDARPAPYLPAGWEAIGQFWGFQADRVSSHAYADAPLSEAEAAYPVLIFSPAGFPPLSLAALLEEIASHGYVVVGVNHTGESALTVFPDGRFVPMDAVRMQPLLGPFSGPPEDTLRARAAVADLKAAEVRFVADCLAALNAGRLGDDRLVGRLDLGRLGAFGHSMGGNAALEWCRLDDRCRAAANLDGGLWNEVGRVGVERPVLHAMADHPEMAMPCADLVRAGIYPSVAWCEAEQAISVGGWQTVYERGKPAYAASIAGSGHISFLDVPFLPIEPGSMMAGGLAGVKIDARRAWRITSDLLLALFGRHLDGAPAPLLDGPSNTYPEVAFGAPRDLLARRAGG